MNSSFRNALILSIGLHASIIGPLSGILHMPEWHNDKKESILVDYVILKEPLKIEEVRQEIDFKLSPHRQETPKAEIVGAIDIKPDQKEIKEREKTSDLSLKKTADEISGKQESLKAASEMAAKQARIKATKDYTNYYHTIREKIRQRLKDNYRNYSKEAEVHTIFTLNSDGTLDAIGIDESGSTSDETLIRITTLSIKEASPFHPFPKALSLPKMSFNLVVSFKRQ